MIGQNIPAPPAAAGVGGSTGSVDNAILRADGTGGATLQSANISIDDATTSTQNNVAITNQHSGQTNSALVLTPKGTGALIAGPKPDGTTTGGNARGDRAVDLAMVRGNAAQVASGVRAISIGYGNTVSGLAAIGLGTLTTSSGQASFAVGDTVQASALEAIAMGGSGTQATASGAIAIAGSAVCIRPNTASQTGATAIGGGGSVANRYAMEAYAAGRFSADGDAQRARFVMRNKTTTNAAVELFLDGSATRLTIPSGKIFAFTINISGVKSDGSAVAHYLRQYCLKNVAGTTSQVYAPVTIGTDNAAGTTIALSANDTNDALKVEVTGITSETWRWVASVDAVEVAYGS